MHIRRTLALALALGVFAPAIAAAQNRPAEPLGSTTHQNLAAEPFGSTTRQNLAAEPRFGSLRSSAVDEASRVATATLDSRDAFTRVRSQSQPRNRNWIARHPAWFGMLVGAGAGAVSAVTMENELFCSGGDEDCFFHGGSRTLVGAGFGAGIGAVTGLIVGLGSK